jgi:hypothetical protein
MAEGRPYTKCGGNNKREVENSPGRLDFARVPQVALARTEVKGSVVTNLNRVFSVTTEAVQF